MTAARRTLPTQQIFTSGSGTYTTPTNCLWIEVTVQGGGAGGGGGQGSATSAGGGVSTFGTSFLTANGGSGGNDSQLTGSAGGTATGGDVNFKGGSGGPSQYSSSSALTGYPGGRGGHSAIFCWWW